jgi:hypothetical protein
MAFRHLESSLHSLHESLLLRHPEGNYEFSGPFDYLKHHFCDFVQIAFLDSQKVENEIAWTFGTL